MIRQPGLSGRARASLQGCNLSWSSCRGRLKLGWCGFGDAMPAAPDRSRVIAPSVVRLFGVAGPRRFSGEETDIPTLINKEGGMPEVMDTMKDAVNQSEAGPGTRRNSRLAVKTRLGLAVGVAAVAGVAAAFIWGSRLSGTAADHAEAP